MDNLRQSLANKYKRKQNYKILIVGSLLFMLAMSMFVLLIPTYV
ncbi:hypothetical protein UFOVP1666_131 [uncultured Caudovirales phage]|uniref:Uncharacterized protein n=1 Tax=uncultured Caudovirales phage TaxID=2100421 RepID=A0A6J5P7Z3_9CAUD|nr:hypothetical protein UFOVP867_86 [uncultured Caudovirales phage]CAB4170797.1 hypothetical protein UFOVP913_112 [uncultured Caudovirales phage]CAB4177088.1 hypothetical protein UFOVP993_165 [uncultured Caudovirales phage]CAB4223099.1 hypothetical protein UFOVP1666_131 [uncultured Caudovirales phage]